ncbi:dethiobiotin synthase [uncultured Shewanella sp.]|uniref:dethiobiotin synthase n=1 Tax=uncultured Shewanella sp. TaxID=173975 RepID=UPI002633CA31|nr:dethiobiotin synthase [uncultured Shewanella sp.]
MTFFVTGTDTDCGKTLISSALLTAAKGETLGFKPIASGCEQTDNGLRNSDALTLMAASSIKLPYDDINPFAFEPAIAPHLAAADKGIKLDPKRIEALLKMSEFVGADFCLIEGAGGWRLPLGEGHFLSEVVQSMQLPVILVVGMKLGCLNHALLTAEAIKADGLNIVGWVANQVEPEMDYLEQNIETLKALLPAPCLGYVPYLAEAKAETAASHLDLTLLA